MKKHNLLLFLVVALLHITISSAQYCGHCEAMRKCKSGRYGDCIICHCACNMDSECEDNEVCAESVEMMCFGPSCPKICQPKPSPSEMSNEPPALASLTPSEKSAENAEELPIWMTGGNGGFPGDDIESDDMSSASINVPECQPCANPEMLCGAFPCLSDPDAKCLIDECKCEARYVDENGNDPNCFAHLLPDDAESVNMEAPDDISDWFKKVPPKGTEPTTDQVPTTTTTPVAPTTYYDIVPEPDDGDQDDVIKVQPDENGEQPTLKVTSEDEEDDDVTIDDDADHKVKRGGYKGSVFYQVIVPTFLVVLVVVVLFLLWKGYGKWTTRRKLKKSSKDNDVIKDPSNGIVIDQEESMQPLNAKHHEATVGCSDDIV